MSRLRTSFVLGFHGCSQKIAEELLQGGVFRLSQEDHDWLGPGVYFWEGDPLRALEWAQSKVTRGSYADAAVIGAVIELGNCLDLTTRTDLSLLEDAYQSFEQARSSAGLAMPQNRDPRGVAEGDKLLRFLDCAVIKHLHENIEDEATAATARGQIPAIAPFDTVRGLFVEGGAVYPGGGFYSRTHTQIAVRTIGSIKGVFLPRSA
ncbi:hypothetical protein [Caulobacter sp.]|uniref:hypothetical protein n=1 Tax=Caulobacter sp. TaxID=78 RepID=UPI003BAAA35B